MVILKKLIFAIPFLLSFIAFCSQLNNFIQDPNLILAFDFQVLGQIIILSILLLSTSLFFIIFASLAQDWKLVLPVILLTSLSSSLFITSSILIILAAGFLLSFGLMYYVLFKKLEAYLTFQAATLLVPSIRQTTTFILLIISLIFYLVSSADIKENGFKLPKGLLDLPMQFTQNMQLPNLESANSEITQPNPGGVSIPPEQIELLKQNPALLKQFGLDAATLDQLSQPKTNQTTKTKTSINATDLVKPMVEKQIEDFIKPYTQYIPIFLAVTFFFTIQSLASIFSIILSPLVWLIFWILEKTGFTKFEIETREVKKLVV